MDTYALNNPVEFAKLYGYTALRFFLLAKARVLLGNNNRLQACWRYPLPDVEHVEIIYSEERKRARARGTMKCGQPWVCPVCTLYISERRRQELGVAVSQVRDRYMAVMVTYTARHDKSMRLADLLKKMQSAYSATRRGRWWGDLKSEFGLVGSIRATEVTYGHHGWHPHYHELLLIDIPTFNAFYGGAVTEMSAMLEAIFSAKWLAELQKQGLTADKEVGLKVTHSHGDVEEYISKYGKMPSESDFGGQADEVSRGSAKSARGGNFTPWELLFYAKDNSTFAALFVEYAHATKGRHQLQWSRDLKALLNIDEIADKIAAEGVETETDIILAKVDLSTWRYAANHGGYMAQIMTVAHEGDAERLRKLIAKIEKLAEAETVTLPQFDLGL